MTRLSGAGAVMSDLGVVRGSHLSCVFVGTSMAALALSPMPAAAMDLSEGPDKRRYWLFNPTPENLMRDLTTDRPDMTESPFTVDAGHIQIESNILGFARSRPDLDRTVTDAHDYGTTNFRIGLTNWVEFNVLVSPHGVVKTRPFDPEQPRGRVSGSAGIDLRMKFNVWGNDKFEKPGDSAFGILPFITIPTGWQNGINPPGIEVGLILPFSVKLSDRWTLGLNADFFMLRNEIEEPGVRPGQHFEWQSSASFCFEWTEQLSTYYEVIGRFGARDSRGDIGILATGFTFKISKNLQLDGGVNFGVTKAADRINPFIGISARF